MFLNISIISVQRKVTYIWNTVESKPAFVFPSKDHQSYFSLFKFWHKVKQIRFGGKGHLINYIFLSNYLWIQHPNKPNTHLSNDSCCFFYLGEIFLLFRTSFQWFRKTHWPWAQCSGWGLLGHHGYDSSTYYFIS